MDDHHSPPSSKKSSAISKVDLVDTPRASPYRTRSRKNSNLTEENIAMHNESPSSISTTRRVTRRMSQGSENASVTLTPMPQAGKRSRRSPSVASDDLVQTPKKKFHVAQENVVMEEDEGLEENRIDGETQSPSLNENGSAQVVEEVEVVNSKVTTNDVDGSMSADNKMPILNDSKQIDEPMDSAGGVENEKVSKAADESLNTSDKENKAAVATSDSDTSNVPVEISTINSKLPETTKASNSEKLGKSASVASPMVQSLKAKSGSVSSPINSNLPESTQPKRTLRSTRSSIVAPNLEKSVSEPISTSVPNSLESKDTAQIKDTVNSSPKELAEANFSLWLGNATNAKSDKFNSNVPVTPSSAATLTRATNAGDDMDVIIIPDTPVRYMPSSITSPQTPASNVSVIEHPIAVSTTNQATPLKTIPAVKKDSSILAAGKNETPSKTVVKSTVLQDVITVPDTAKNSLLETPGKTLAKTPSKAVSQVTSLVKSTLLQGDVTIIVPDTPKNSLLETPGKTLAKTPSKDVSQVTPVEKSTVEQDDLNITVAETPTKSLRAQIPSLTTQITPLVKSTVPQDDVNTTIPETPSKTVSVLVQETEAVSTSKQTESILETPSKTIANTPLKDVSVVAQDTMAVSTSSKKNSLKTLPIEEETTVTNTETPSKTVPATNVTNQGISSTSPNKELKNGIEDEDKEYPKWGFSVHRKSDGGPIDSFGMKKDAVETTLTVKHPTKKNASIISVNDSSEDDGPRNDFIDDEAEETNGEDSMDAEERQYLEENEIPVDGISLGSDTDCEELSDENENDSFIVSDSSNQLLDGSGDDLEIGSDAEPKNKSRRSNKILDTSDEELEVDAESRKSVNSKKRSKMDKSSNKIGDSSDESVAEELANLDTEPKIKAKSKRLSDTISLSKKDIKRRSLHPNTKLNCDDLQDDQNKSMFTENGPSANESGEENVSAELANLDSKPKKTSSLKRLSDTAISSKKDAKRMSLHPSAKLNSGLMKDDPNKSISDNGPSSDGRSKNDMAEELANLDAEPKKAITSKRLSDAVSHSKKEAKRLSLHPNAKLNSGKLKDDQNKSTIAEKNTNVGDSSEEDVTEVLANLDDAPSSSQQQERSLNYAEIEARCDSYLNAVNNAKREQKSTPKAIQEEKYQKLKEKKAMKLQEKKDKEARMLQQEALFAKQRQLKKEKKSNLAKVTDEEKSKAIEKALAFSNKIKSIKNQHSTEMKQESPAETGGEISAGTTPKKKSRKRKLLQILEDVPQKKIRFSQEQQIPAKPEGFMIHSRPIPNKILRKGKMKQRKVVSTSSGNFVVEPMPKKVPSPFTVTTLKYSPPPSFKNKVVFNANIQRESAAQLLARKKKLQNN